MRYLCLILILILSGCIQHNPAQDPISSGIVIDGNSGHPMAGVQIVEITKNIEKEKSFITTINGLFSYSDIFSPLPGAKVESSAVRSISFKKKGYRDVTCSCTDRSFEDHVKIPLLKISASTLIDEPAVFLSISGTDIACQVFIGSSVNYEKQKYRLERINRREECGFEYFVFTLVSETGERIDVSEPKAITLTSKQ